MEEQKTEYCFCFGDEYCSGRADTTEEVIDNARVEWEEDSLPCHEYDENDPGIHIDVYTVTPVDLTPVVKHWLDDMQDTVDDFIDGNYGLTEDAEIKISDENKQKVIAAVAPILNRSLRFPTYYAGRKVGEYFVTQKGYKQP